MPKKPVLENTIYDYLLYYFESRYDEKQAIKRGKKEMKKFPTIESIVDLIFEDQAFFDSEKMDEDPRPDQIKISRGTIRKAIRRLITECKIAISQGSYEFVPHMESSLEQHPILDIASKVDISIGVPAETIVLSVAPEHTLSVANYLSAIFYQGDVVFIPFTGKILCISIFPKSVLDKGGDLEQSPSKRIALRQRIELALHSFKCSYPDFPYGQTYELAYHLSHNPDMIQTVDNMIQMVSVDGRRQNSRDIAHTLQEAAFWMAEQTEKNPQLWAKLNTEDENEDDLTGFPRKEEMELWDYSVDEE